jgi:hypothetical protein
MRIRGQYRTINGAIVRLLEKMRLSRLYLAEIKTGRYNPAICGSVSDHRRDWWAAYLDAKHLILVAYEDNLQPFVK